MKVLITTSSFGKNDNKPLELMAENNLEYILNPYQRKLSEDELIELIQEYKPDFLIAGTEKMTPKALNTMKPYVKMISRCGIGMDGIDLNYAKQINIPVTNTPDAPTMPVAELTLGVILDLLREITFSNNSVKSGGFKKPMGQLLHGKTVGIIGCGRIGSHLAKLLQPFECNIIGHDPFLKQHTMIQLKPFDDVVKQADILTLHIPLTQENKYIINKKTLSNMKQNAFLINISRGGLINENDLIEALTNNQIAGAGIDCYESEPYTGELINFDNVILTSHIGSYAKEARVKQELDSIKNILEVL